MDAAREFLASLSDEQRAKAVRQLDDESERRTWFYWPAPRAGLSLGDMTAEQAKAAHHLVADFVSLAAVAKEDAARRLLEAVGEPAIVSPDAPDDILTMNAPKLDELPNDGGVRVGRAAEDLVAVYLERMRSDIAGREMDRLRPQLDELVFAWA